MESIPSFVVVIVVDADHFIVIVGKVAEEYFCVIIHTSLLVVDFSQLLLLMFLLLLLLLLLLLQRNIPVLWSVATSECVIAGTTVVCVDVGRSAVFSASVLSEDKAKETSFQVSGRGMGRTEREGNEGERERKKEEV